jgi:cell shape-determining protein MreD
LIAAVDWIAVKQWLAAATGLHMDALHIHAGIAVQLAAAFVTRRTLASPIPWLAVLAFTVANELYDYAFEVWPGEERARQRAEGFRDLWNTLLVPTLLFIVSRWAPGLWRREAAVSTDPGEPGEQPR